MTGTDNINTFDDANEYISMAQHGIIRTLQDSYKALKEAHRRSEDEVVKTLIESVILKIEAQLDY